MVTAQSARAISTHLSKVTNVGDGPFKLLSVPLKTAIQDRSFPISFNNSPICMNYIVGESGPGGTRLPTTSGSPRRALPHTPSTPSAMQIQQVETQLHTCNQHYIL